MRLHPDYPVNDDHTPEFVAIAAAMSTADPATVKQATALCVGMLYRTFAHPIAAAVIQNIVASAVDKKWRLGATRYSPPMRNGLEVADEVARECGVTIEDMISPTRTRRVSVPRQRAMYEMYKRCPQLSTPAIGKLLGGRDHTTVLYGIKAHEARMAAE